MTAGILPASEDPPSLYRVWFAPDTIYPLAVDPAIGLVYVESVTLVLRLGAPVTIMHAGENDAPGEPIGADTEVTLSPGDYTTFPPGVGGEDRSEGQDPAQVAVAGLVPEQLVISLMGAPVP